MGVIMYCNNSYGNSLVKSRRTNLASRLPSFILKSKSITYYTAAFISLLSCVEDLLTRYYKCHGMVEIV